MHSLKSPLSSVGYDNLCPGRYAAIDIGTVTCRLLIADVDKSGLHEITRGYGITNLGEGVDATGYLKPEAMQRVADQVKRFKETITSYQTPDHPHIKVIAMATSAARDAHNGDEFHAMLQKLGIGLTIIPGEKEAALSFAGVANDFPGEDLLVVDVGGGSTEFSAGSADEAPQDSFSFDIGCRRITERYFHEDPPTEQELADARQSIASAFKGYFTDLEERAFHLERMVAVAGTATSVVSIHKQMKVYDVCAVHRSVISRQILEAVFKELCAKTLVERKKIIGLDPDRASVIIAGVLILDVAMELAGQDHFTVSESDILQGIILDTAAK